MLIESSSASLRAYQEYTMPRLCGAISPRPGAIMVTLASSTSFAQQRPLMLWMQGVISHSLARLTGTHKRTPMKSDTESLGLELTNGIDNRRSPKPTHKHAPSECWPPLLPNLWNTSVRTVPLGPSEAQKSRGGCSSSFIDTLEQKRLYEALGTPTKVYSVVKAMSSSSGPWQL